MGMAQTLAHAMPSVEQIATGRWLPDDALRVYSGEYRRTGLQGGLNWYRAAQSAAHSAAQSATLQPFSGLAMHGLGRQQLRHIQLLPGTGHRAPGTAGNRSSPRRSTAGCWTSHTLPDCFLPRSKRSRSITLAQAATKSLTKTCCASLLA